MATGYLRITAEVNFQGVISAKTLLRSIEIDLSPFKSSRSHYQRCG